MVTRSAVEIAVASVTTQTVLLERALQASPDAPEVLGALARRLGLSGEVRRAEALLARIPMGPERDLTQAALWIAKGQPHRARSVLDALGPSAKARGLARLLQQGGLSGMRVSPAVYAACRQAAAALSAGDAPAALRFVQPHLGSAVGDPWVLAAKAMAAMGDPGARGPLLSQALEARTWFSSLRMEEALEALADGPTGSAVTASAPLVAPEGCPRLSVVVWGDPADDATDLVGDVSSADAIFVVGAACGVEVERAASLAHALAAVSTEVTLFLHATLRAGSDLVARHRRGHQHGAVRLQAAQEVDRQNRLGDGLVRAVCADPLWCGATPVHVSAPTHRLNAKGCSLVEDETLPLVLAPELRAVWVTAPPVSLLVEFVRSAGAAAHAPVPRPRSRAAWGQLLTVRARCEAERQQVLAVQEQVERLALGPLSGAVPLDRTAARLRTALDGEQSWARAQATGLKPPMPPCRDRLMSIIMLNLNGQGHLQGAVESLRRNTPGPVELVVVDNGSTDPSLEWLRAQDDLVLLELGENLGAPAGRNRGLEVARGGTVLFCDNDVVFTPGWRPLLLAHLDAWPDVGAVGPMSDVVIGPQLTEGPPAGASLGAWAQAFSAARAGQAQWTQRLILFCMLFRREALDEIGGLDTRFWRWGFEDDDLSYRLARAGWSQRIASDCFIQHLGSRTASRAQLDYDALLQENFRRFADKWKLDSSLEYGDPIPTDAILAPDWNPETDVVPYRRPGVSLPSGAPTLLRFEAG